MDVYVRDTNSATGSGKKVFEIARPSEAEGLIAEIKRGGGIYLVAESDNSADISHQFVLEDDGSCYCELIVESP